MIKPLLVPYLMGQRRDGLQQLAPLCGQPWQVVSAAGLTSEHIADRNEQLRRMGLVYAQLAAQVRQARAHGQMPLCVAGDCVASLGMLAGLQQAGCEPQRLLWLDAHGDFHTWATTQTRYVGGMPLAMLVGRPDRRRDARDSSQALRAATGCRHYPERQVLLSDARDLDPGEDEALRQSAIVRCTLDQVLAQLSPHESLYVHFDTDVLDEAQRLPALKYHVADGPRLEQMAQLFRQLSAYNLLAVSVSAWHAERDGAGHAATACLALLHLLVGRRHGAAGRC
jgi:arginase